MSGRRNKAGKPGASRQALSAHRLFPVAVAIWSAALFGLSSLAVSAQVFESVVTSLGLPAVLPAAAPPLGFTARLLLALMMAVAGGLGGLVAVLVARRGAAGGDDADVPVRQSAAPTAASPVAEPAAVRLRRRDAHPDAPPRRPLVLTEDLLPLTTPADVPHAPAPFAARAEPEVLELDCWPADPVDSEVEEVAFVEVDAVEVDAVEVDAVEVDQVEAAFERVHPIEVAAFAPEPAVEAVFAPADYVPADDTPVAVAPVAAVPVAPRAAPPAPPLPPILPHALASFAAPAIPDPLVPGAPRSPLAQTPVETLGLVQLIERLALALAERRALREAAAEAAPPMPSVTPAVDDAPAFLQSEPSVVDPYAAPAEATPPSMLLRTKPGRAAGASAWRDDTHGETAEGMIAPPPFAPPVASADGDDDDPAPADDDRYPSLLGMSLSTLSRHVGRVDDTPPFAASAAGLLSDELAGPVADFGHVREQLMAAPVDPLPTDPFAGAAVPLAGPGLAPVVPFLAPRGTGRREPNVLAAGASAAVPPPVDAAAADQALRDALDTLRRMTAKG